MKVTITFDIVLDERKAISLFHGQDTPATYDDVKQHISAVVRGDLEDLCYTLQLKEERDKER